jgi:hypothetical protein
MRFFGAVSSLLFEFWRKSSVTLKSYYKPLESGEIAPVVDG